MIKHVLSGVLLAAAGACASAPTAPETPPPSPPMVSVFTVAHQDDWQLFMNPEAYHGMDEPQEKAVFIHVTAGDAGAGAGGEVVVAARAEADEVPWYSVMVRTLRADYTARWAPHRSLVDARQAQREALELGDVLLDRLGPRRSSSREWCTQFEIDIENVRAVVAHPGISDPVARSLAAFIALVFALTVVKVTEEGKMKLGMI